MSFNAGNISKADATAYSSSDSDDNDDDGFAQQTSADPRADSFGDFNPRKRRRTGRNAKESAALGIFASDSEDEGPSRKWKGKKDLRHKNMTFVSAGTQKMNEENDSEEEEEEEEEEYAEPGRFGIGAKTTKASEDEEDDDEDESMAGVGLGFRPSGQGLGWAPPTQAAAPPTTSIATPQKPFTKSRNENGTPLGTGFVPSSAKQPVLKANLEDGPSSAPQTPKPSMFSSGGGSKKMSFAQKMMAKMGYVEGQGLGAEGQGRNVIIEATLRPQGVGLGAVREKSKQEREEEKRQARLRGDQISDSDDEKTKKKRERKRQGLDSGTASGTSTPRRPKTKYLTVNDIKKAAPGLHIPDAFAPILDMTGPDQKMLTTGSGLLTPTAGSEVVEQTESRKLAGRAQRELNAFVEEWKTLEERKAWLGMETLQRQQELDELEAEFSNLQLLASVVNDISQAAQNREWDPIIAGLRNIEATGHVEDEDLAAIAVAAIHPFMRDAVQGWQPLEDPKLGALATDLGDIQGVLGLTKKAVNGNALTKWNDIEGIHRQHQKSTTPYESMLYKLLFPKLITAISQQWDVYDAASLLAVFDKWESLFPAFIRSQLLDQVVRRLNDAISNWKPKKKQHNLPHLWLFPWLQHLPPHHLDPKGTGIVADVRRKFRQLIDVWEFDRGVIPGLKQWKDIFRPSKSQDQWKPLVMNHILPSMAKYLRTNFRVNPADQEPYLPMITGVLKWADTIAPSMVAEVIVAEVFPLWHDVLYQWLTSDEPNYEEVATWFEWWQDTVFADIGSLESILSEFKKGSAMLEHALELGANAKTELPKPDRQPAHQLKPHPRKPHQTVSVDKSPPAVQPIKQMVPLEKSFRDELEEWCTEHDLRFIPIHKSTDQGEKYLRMTARMDGKGGVLTYLKKGVDVMVVESRKNRAEMELIRDQKEGWDILLETLLKEVE